MMFVEKEVFKGLTAWFSSSVPASVGSEWVKHGGLKTSEVNNADFIFSSSAAAKDTLRIFESQKYKSEELTIFNSSLIEDTLASGKMYLSGKYTGSYILVHPAYQREIESFHREKCPRFHKSDIQLTAVVGDSGTAQKNIQGKEGMVSLYQQPVQIGDEEFKDWDFRDQSQEGGPSEENCAVDKEGSDEWDFKDESNIHVRNIMEARKLSGKPANCGKDRNNIVLSNSSSDGVSDALPSSAFKQVGGVRLSSPEEENLPVGNSIPNTSVTFLSVDKERRICLDESYSAICTNGSRQSRNIMEGDRDFFKDCSETRLQDVEEKETFLDDRHLKNTSTSATPRILRSRFLSSMDDGFVHIDDIELPVTPIDDFIPNRNGCRVHSK